MITVTRTYAVVVSCVSLMGAVGSISRDDSHTLDAIVTALEARHATLQDLRVEYRCEDYYLPGHRGVKEGRLRAGFAAATELVWMKKGTKQYFRKERPVKGSVTAKVTEWTWDDEEIRYIDHTVYAASVTSKPSPQDESYKPYQFYDAEDFNVSWAELAKKAILVDTKTTDQGIVYRLRMPKRDNRWEYLVDFAVDRGLAPIYIEEFANGFLMRVYEFTDLAQTPGGIWYPRRLTTWLYRYDSELAHHDPARAGNREEFYFESVEINSGIPDSQFTLEIPESMSVTHLDLGTVGVSQRITTAEAIRQVTNHIGEELDKIQVREGRDRTPAITAESRSERLNTESRQQMQKQKSRLPEVMIIAFVLVVSIALLIALYSRRKRYTVQSG